VIRPATLSLPLVHDGGAVTVAVQGEREVWTDRTVVGLQSFTVLVEIDANKLALALAHSAAHNRTGRASLAHGKIKARVTRMGDVRPAEGGAA
jgi:hypothetical protein